MISIDRVHPIDTITIIPTATVTLHATYSRSNQLFTYHERFSSRTSPAEIDETKGSVRRSAT